MSTFTASPPIVQSSPRARFPVVLAAWAAAASLVTATGVLTVERRVLVPLTVLSTTVAMVVAHLRGGAFGAWTRGLSMPMILAFQALRAPIGMAFLLWAAQGIAPVGFASGAGYGDLAVGVLALALLARGDAVTQHRGWLLAWNILGLLDIALVVLGAQVRFVLLDPSSLAGLLETPFPLLPLFYVPLVIASHLLVFTRLRSPERG